LNTHTRNSYTVLDILGKLGGIEKSLKGIIGFFFIFISKNTMKCEFASKLLLLKAKEMMLFNDGPYQGDPEEYVDVELNMKT
jgi:hypothetical protein